MINHNDLTIETYALGGCVETWIFEDGYRGTNSRMLCYACDQKSTPINRPVIPSLEDYRFAVWRKQSQKSPVVVTILHELAFGVRLVVKCQHNQRLHYSTCYSPENADHTISILIAILFIFPLMFKTNMFHITLAPRRFKLSLIAKRCQGRVVISLFSNMTL